MNYLSFAIAERGTKHTQKSRYESLRINNLLHTFLKQENIEK